MVTLVRARQTSVACPSQWDAWDGAGNYWYLRYRGAFGSARQYAQGPAWYLDESYPEPAETLSFDNEDADPLDGCIGLEEFARRAGLTLALEE